MNTLSAANLSTVAPSTAPQIIQFLADQANTVLGPVLSQPLVSFQPGALGNFPYYYLDPDSLNFNAKTYAWINNAMASDEAPIQQSPGTLFTNQMISALSTVTYALSQADQAALNAAYSNAQNQQMALLQAWTAKYGKPVPGNNQQPIDAIVTTICTTWATPPTTLNAVQSSTNLRKLLNNAPASGQALLPLFANYIDALGASVTLANAVTMNNAYVAMALDALQSPSAANGAIELNDNSGYHPAYSVSTALDQIIDGLEASNQVQLKMDVSLASESEYSVTIQGKAAFSIPFDDFFTLDVGGSASYFHDEMVQNASSVSVAMTFTGVTLVNYGPVAFDESTMLDWYTIQPILAAIQNGTRDVTGFRFSPNPGIDFGPDGSFGILQGIVIANYPSIQITVTSSDYASIQTTFQQQASASLSFLGIPLGGGSESTYSNSAQSNSAQSSVTVTLNPPPDMVAGTNTDSVGWILGVQPYYPTVSATPAAAQARLP